MRKVRTLVLLAGAVLAPAMLSGCFNPFSMGLFTPIPVPPWVAERMEEKYAHKADFNTPVMPPIKEGTRPYCEDPPDLASVLRAMPHVTRGIPYFYEEFRDDINYTVERIVDRIDPPRFYPLIGPAQLHHCHWRCTVYYTGTVESGYPFPVQVKRRRVEVVYIDKDHLHLVACTPETQRALADDVKGY